VHVQRAPDCHPPFRYRSAEQRRIIALGADVMGHVHSPFPVVASSQKHVMTQAGKSIVGLRAILQPLTK
jgi:hypothetical protein